MTCLHCGVTFSATRNKQVVCPECISEYRKTLGYLDATANITREDAEKWRDELEKHLTAVNMLIEGASLSAISEKIGMDKQRLSLLFSRHVNKAAREPRSKGEPRVRKFIQYKPVWPESLYCAVFGEKNYDDMPHDVEETIERVLDTITPREKIVIIGRVKDESTLDELAEQFNLTRERIRQIEAKALRKLRYRDRAEMLKNGIMVQAEIVKARKEEAEIESKRRVAELAVEAERRRERFSAVQERIRENDELNHPIEVLDLTVRSYNCLTRNGIKTVQELADTTLEKLSRIHNLGQRSISEILFKCEKNGIAIRAECEKGYERVAEDGK